MFFWNFYALFYNKLNELIPYQEHVSNVLKLFKLESDKTYLDLGCGSGNLIQDKKNIVGVDISTAMLGIAKKRNTSARFVASDLNATLPFKNGAFDGGYTSNVVAYLQDPKKFFLEVQRILKPGAEFVVATLRPQFSPVKILQAHIKKASLFHFLSNLVFIFIIYILNVPITRKLKKNIYHGFEIDTLGSLVAECGFEVLDSRYTYADQDVLLLLRRK